MKQGPVPVFVEDRCKIIHEEWRKGMTQDERWLAKYDEVKSFIVQNHRNPSRHRIEEHDMLNWLKANRKHLNAGAMKPERIELFKQLLVVIEENKHVNQYV